MTRRDRKRRKAPISYRPPERLREEFRTRVANSGLSINAFITAAVFGQEAPRARPAPPVDRQMVALLLSQAARINDRLQAAASLSPDPAHTSSLLAECRDELAEIRTCLMLALGRDP